jgi:hypothetical protein
VKTRRFSGFLSDKRRSIHSELLLVDRKVPIRDALGVELAESCGTLRDDGTEGQDF